MYILVCLILVLITSTSGINSYRSPHVSTAQVEQVEQGLVQVEQGLVGLDQVEQGSVEVEQVGQGLIQIYQVEQGLELDQVEQGSVELDQVDQVEQGSVQVNEHVLNAVDVYCECVPYYLCVDGVISTSGEGMIDVRAGSRYPVFNVKECPYYIDICCGIPVSTTTTAYSTASTTFTTPTSTLPVPPEPTTLPPNTPCTCVPFLECPAERVVSDGKGNTTLEFLGFSYSHSKCHYSFYLCCAIEPTPTNTPPTTEPPCQCVQPHLCENGTIIVDGSGLIDVRLSSHYVHPPQPPQPGECDEFLVCCHLPPPPTYPPKPTTPTTTTTTTTTTTASSTTTPTTYDKSQKINNNPSTYSTSTTASITTTTTTTPEPNHCGLRNLEGISARILGFLEGESQFGEFPWVVAVLNSAPIMGKPTYLFIGGGTLIHPRVVMTAAHKLKSVNYKYLSVRLGEWDTQTEQEPHPHQDIEVEYVLVHPYYHPTALYFDVALLFLKEEAVLGSHVNTICMASSLEEVSPYGCVINGWGVNAFSFEEGGEYQRVMKSVTLPLVQHQECQEKLRRTRLGRYFRLHPTFVCAGGEEGKDACKGDGGGPLACPRLDGVPGQYMLVGMTAWGIGCGDADVPGVYVNVPTLRPWINENMQRYLSYFTTTTTERSTTTKRDTTPTYTRKSQIRDWITGQSWKQGRTNSLSKQK